MSRLRVLSLINVCAGLWLLVAPFALHLPRSVPLGALLTGPVIGIAVLLLSAVHGLQWESARRGSRINVSLGLVLAASPLLLEYGHPNGPGRTAAVNAMVTGAVVVAGAALCLAGSGFGEEAAPAPPVQPAPELWSVPVGGGEPRPFSSRADAQSDAQGDQENARAKLPWAWLSVALMIAGAVVVGLAIVLVSWPLAGAGAAVGAIGAGLALRVRILSDVSLGQSPERA